MKITRPLFKYFGSKWKISAHYPKPICDTIIEPFAGSACYSLRHHEREVILIEKNKRIADLWKWLVTAPSEIIASLPSFEGEQGLNLFDWAEQEGYPKEAAELVIRWQRVGTNDCPTISKWNGTSGQWDLKTRDLIAETVQKIKHWHAFHDDYSLATPCSEATLFVDPPYQGQSFKVYRNSEGLDYNTLGTYCQDAAWEQVIVCENTDADWLPFKHFKTIKTGRTGHHGKENSRSREALYHSINRQQDPD